MTKSPAAANAIKISAIFLLVAGGVALALDGFRYTKNHEDSPGGALEISEDMSRQVTMPIWSGVGALMLGGALLMIPMNRKNQIGSNEVAILVTHPPRETAMNNQPTSKNTPRPQPKATKAKQRKSVILRTKDEEARQENEGGPPVKRSKTA